MKKIFGLISLLLSPIILTAQTYSPTTVGSKWHYSAGTESFTQEIIESNFTYNDKEYIKVLSLYSWGGEAVGYFRVDSDGNTFSFDVKIKIESLIIPGQPKTGDSWITADKAWKYTIIDIAATFSASSVFKNCLKIKVEPIGYHDDERRSACYNYYAKGIGLVGMKGIRGGTIADLLIWDVK